MAQIDRFLPESKIVINTIVEDWFDKYDRQFVGSRQLEDLKESLYENLKLFKDLK